MLLRHCDLCGLNEREWTEGQEDLCDSCRRRMLEIRLSETAAIEAELRAQFGDAVLRVVQVRRVVRRLLALPKVVLQLRRQVGDHVVELLEQINEDQERT